MRASGQPRGGGWAQQRAAALCTVGHRRRACRGVRSTAAAAAATEEDGVYMRRAIELAKTATGKTFPNPLVRNAYAVSMVPVCQPLII